MTDLENLEAVESDWTIRLAEALPGTRTFRVNGNRITASGIPGAATFAVDPNDPDEHVYALWRWRRYETPEALADAWKAYPAGGEES